VNSVGASPKFTVKYMNDLLQVAADAHGGLARWNQLKNGKGKGVDHRRNLASEG
jgi:hypothetical protein